MLVIRFFRVGKKNQPSYKIVVTDKRKPPASGRFVEEVGFYNPLTKEKVLRGERIKYWLSVGAKPSDTVYNLLVGEKILEGKKIPKHKVSKKEQEKPAPEEKVEKVITEQKPETEKQEIPKPEETEQKKEEQKPEVEKPEEIESKKEEQKPTEESPKEEKKEVKTE